MTTPETAMELSPEEIRFLLDMRRRITPPLVPDWHRRPRASEEAPAIDRHITEGHHV